MALGVPALVKTCIFRCSSVAVLIFHMTIMICIQKFYSKKPMLIVRVQQQFITFFFCAARNMSFCGYDNIIGQETRVV